MRRGGPPPNVSRGVVGGRLALSRLIFSLSALDELVGIAGRNISLTRVE